LDSNAVFKHLPLTMYDNATTMPNCTTKKSRHVQQCEYIH